MQKIVIDKFRQITHAEIELRDFVFLIGEQASGKSTIAKLIYFFKSLKQEYIAFFDEDGILDFGTIVKQKLTKNIQDKFAVYFGKSYLLDDDFKVTYFFSTEEDFYVTLSKKNESLNFSFSDKQWKVLCEESYQLIGELKRTPKISKINQTGKLPSQSAFFDEQRREMSINRKKILAANKIFCDERDCMFLPAGRNITVSYPSQFQMLFYGELRFATYEESKDNSIDLLLMRDFFSYSRLLTDYFSSQQLVKATFSSFDNKINENIMGILRGKYKNESGYEKIMHGDDSHFTPLSKASSGQQEAIRIIQDAMYILIENLKASRIIEEPETHLFPKAQQLLIQLLTLVANKTNNQIIITTHSPQVMATFNNLLYYSRTILTAPDKKREIENRFGTNGFDDSQREQLNITINKLQAYSLNPSGEPYCKSILDSSTGLIGENFIDEATESIYDEFDFLYSLIS